MASGIIDAELSLTFSTIEALDETLAGLPVLTRDVRRYSGYFPTVVLVAPD